jgi:hypothetical protein
MKQMLKTQLTTTTAFTYAPPVAFKPFAVPKIAFGVPKGSLKRKTDLKTLFSVQIRRFGKFKEVSQAPLGVGLKIGQRKTAQTLGQTFRLIPVGKTRTPDIRAGIRTDIFTTPKKRTAPLEFVERRGMTLKKGTGEIAEIQRARKRAERFKPIRRIAPSLKAVKTKYKKKKPVRIKLI